MGGNREKVIFGAQAQLGRSLVGSEGGSQQASLLLGQPQRIVGICPSKRIMGNQREGVRGEWHRGGWFATPGRQQCAQCGGAPQQQIVG